jgi:hypothetical protein
LATIGWFDLVIAVLISAVVLLLGQAMTAFELFTEKTLPRREVVRQWRRAILLAAGYGVLMGGALAWGLEPEYAVLLTALLMTAFFALQSWRSRVEWEQAMRQLRPFVASQRWYDSLIMAQADEQVGPEPFQVLCENLLNTTTAYLIPTGSTAALIAAQRYPAERTEPALGSLAQQALTQTALICPSIRSNTAEPHGPWRCGVNRGWPACCCSARGVMTASTLKKKSRSRALPANGSSTWRPASRSPNA